MSFNLIFMGAEQSGWRTLAEESGVTFVGTSYWSLRKRLPKKGISFFDWGFDDILLDSGGHAANKKPEQLTIGEWREYGEEYARFAHEHSAEVSLITEFDCHVLGPEWVQEQRDTVWADIDPAKFVPVWHPDRGLDDLNNLADRYGQVGITSDSVSTRNSGSITPHLNALARDGVRLHGIAMTKPTVLKQVQFTTASSTSWLSPGQFGDTILWVNGSLVRYPRGMKEQARRRHALLFEELGFDVGKILADDSIEVTRVALWSWVQQEQAIREAWGDDSAEESNSASLPTNSGSAPTEGNTVDMDTPENAHKELVTTRIIERPEEEMKTLPGFGTKQREVIDPDTQTSLSLPVIEIRGTTAKRCDTCVIKLKCPEFKINSTCAYSIPVSLETKEQKRALLEGMMEMQTQRVQFMRLVEEINGGYADPNLSQEVDRLLKMMTTQADLEDGRDFFSMNITGRGNGGGIMAELFGNQNAARAAPVQRVITQEGTDDIMSRLEQGKKVT